MKVTLIAKTELTKDRMAFSTPAVLTAAPDWSPNGWVAEEAELLVEFAGRACYQSWSNPSGRDTESYIDNILGQGHFSVLEHASASFYIEGVSRSLTHELVRHRHLSFSQLSQRFVNLEDAGYVVPPALQAFLDDTEAASQAPFLRGVLESAFEQSKVAYTALAAFLETQGLGRKRAREAARAVLPNMVETSIVVTGNHRSWREFVQKRFSVHADAEIRELADLLLTELRAIAPAIYQDISAEPAG